jgi:hypothetical protein
LKYLKAYGEIRVHRKSLAQAANLRVESGALALRKFIDASNPEIVPVAAMFSAGRPIKM